MEKYYFQSFFDKDIWEVGPAWQSALGCIYSDPDFGPSHDHTRNIFEMFMLMGDPSLLLPGTMYGHLGNHFRIGFGRENLPAALARLAQGDEPLLLDARPEAVQEARQGRPQKPRPGRQGAARQAGKSLAASSPPAG